MKRMLSVFLSVACMLAMLTAVPLSSSADGPVAARVGYTVSLIQKKSGLADLKDVKDGLVTGVKEYKITDAEGLEKVAHIANGTGGETRNTFAGYTLYLANDIDMTGVTHEPIGLAVTDGVCGTAWVASGEPTPSFRGIFDGQGYAIKNWVVEDNGAQYKQIGLFGQLAVAEIRNLIIDESCSITYEDAGGTQVSFISAYAYWGVLYTNISVRGTLNNVKSTYVGGIAARMHGGGNVIFTNCEMRGDIIVTSADHVGGLVGSTHWEIGKGTLQFINCRMAGNITSNNFTGGFIAIVSRCPKATFTNCINNGIINGYADRTGGFVGSTQSGGINLTFTDCFNYGESRNKPFLGVATNTISEAGSGLTVNGIAYDTPIAEGTYGTSFGTFTAGEDPTLNLPDDEPEEPGNDDPGDVTTDPVLPDDTTGAPEPVEAPPADYVGYTGSRIERKNVGPVPNILKFDTVRSAEYKITTPEGLVFFSRIVNSGEPLTGRTVYLANDIDMTGVTDFEPIGKSVETYFGGTFDGQGHMIENLTVISTDPGYTSDESEYMVYVGLFGVVADATIRNLILGEHCSLSYEGTANNVNVAGLVGCSTRGIGKTTIIDNCWNLATVEANSDSGTAFAAGFVARPGSTTSITNSTNSGAISGNISVGGFTGYTAATTIRNCRNTGTITLKNFFGDAWHTASGFVARPAGNNACRVEGCINNGAIVGPSFIGAFYGSVRFSGNSAKNCTNYGLIQASSDASGATSGVVGAIVPSDGYPGAGKTNVAFKAENVEDKSGEEDPTLALMETIIADYTPAPDTAPETTVPDHNESGEGTPSTRPGTTTTDPTDGTDPSSEPEKKGCSSAVTGVILLPALLCLLPLLKKKED